MPTKPKETIFDKINHVLASKSKGDIWVQEAAPVLVDVKREKDEVEGERELEMAPLKSAMSEIKEKFKAGLDILEAMEGDLRDRIKAERVGTETIKTDNGGSLQFPESLGFKYTNINLVDKKYTKLVLDEAKIKKAIKEGAREIKGIKIDRVYGLRVLTEDRTMKEE